MASENETISDIVNEMRTLGRLDEKSTDKIPRSLQALGLRTYADRIEAVHLREVGELCGERNGILNANASLADDNDRLRREVSELKREVTELRECLKETMADAVAEYKNNSCFRNVKCGEIERCDTCKVMKWRKVLKGASND